MGALPVGGSHMTGQYLTIDAKHRQMPAMHASLADFSVTSGEAVSADIVISNPNISLYCLDDAARQAIFVELPPDVDLAKEVFVYQTQYDEAQRLVVMHYDTFRQVARQLPEVQQLIMIYMTGRCGSTLLSFLFKPTPFKTPSTFALKLRNEGTQLMDLFQATFPQARNLFLYRDAIGYVQSFYRIFKRSGAPECMPVG